LSDTSPSPFDLSRVDLFWAVEAVVVAKPKKKIPRVFVAKLTFVLADEGWLELEKAFGRVLDTKTRQEILDATSGFLRLAVAESETGLMDDAIKHTKRHRRRALALVESLYVTPERLQDYALLDYVHATIAGIRGNLKPLFAELEWFIKACNVALEQMTSTSSHHFWPDGFAWQGWIKQLTEIAASHHLPTAARKDTDKAKEGTDSPFVLFVDRLQSYIPAEHRRSTQSLAALSTAINAARRNRKKPL
jgi:hypothetical protein